MLQVQENVFLDLQHQPQKLISLKGIRSPLALQELQLLLQAILDIHCKKFLEMLSVNSYEKDAMGVI